MPTEECIPNANLPHPRLVAQVNIAKEFRNHVIYFPYNMDFRGRTYPIPPNLNILGSDFSRGVLVFDEARPLGENGLYWLKVHTHLVQLVQCAILHPFS